MRMAHIRKRRVSSLPSVYTCYRRKNDVRVRHEMVPPARFSQAAAGGLPEGHSWARRPCGEARGAVCRLLTSNWQRITMSHGRHPMPSSGKHCRHFSVSKIPLVQWTRCGRPRRPGNRGVMVWAAEMFGFIPPSRPWRAAPYVPFSCSRRMRKPWVPSVG